MKNSDLSLTNIYYNALVQTVGHKKGCALFGKSSQSLLNMAYTLAYITKQPTCNSIVADTYRVKDYSLVAPNDELAKLVNSSTCVAYSDDAIAASITIGTASRAIIVDDDKIDGADCKLLTPDEFTTVVNSLSIGQYAVKDDLKAVNLAKTKYILASKLSTMYDSTGDDAYLPSQKDENVEVSEILCFALLYVAENGFENCIPRTVGTSLETVFSQLAGIDIENSVQGTNPWKRNNGKS